MLGTESQVLYKDENSELVAVSVVAGCPCPVEVPSHCSWDAFPFSILEKAGKRSPDPLNRFEGRNLPTALYIDSNALFLPGQIPALGKEQSVQVQIAFNCRMYLTMEAFRLDMIQPIEQQPEDAQ